MEVSGAGVDLSKGNTGWKGIGVGRVAASEGDAQ